MNRAALEGIIDQLQAARAVLFITIGDDDELDTNLIFDEVDEPADMDPATIALLAVGAESAGEQYVGMAVNEASRRSEEPGTAWSSAADQTAENDDHNDDRPGIQ